MNPDPIVFAMANPDPEVSPEEALPHVRILATGRSDYPNQINNVLCFPGHLPRRARRPRRADHRDDEDRRRARDRRHRVRRRAARGLHHPLGVQPRGGAGGGRRGGRRGARQRAGRAAGRARVRGDRGAACRGASPGGSAGRWWAVAGRGGCRRRAGPRAARQTPRLAGQTPRLARQTPRAARQAPRAQARPARARGSRARSGAGPSAGTPRGRRAPGLGQRALDLPGRPRSRRQQEHDHESRPP